MPDNLWRLLAVLLGDLVVTIDNGGVLSHLALGPGAKDT